MPSDRGESGAKILALMMGVPMPLPPLGPDVVEEFTRTIYGRTPDGGKLSDLVLLSREDGDIAATIDGLDVGRAVVIGHSRLGKAALWAGVRDERFALTVSNDSGCCGASLFRHAGGEDIEAITRKFPHWFVPSFAQYAGKED